MRTSLSCAWVLMLAAVAGAQEPAAPDADNADAIGRISSSAQGELAKSIQDLNALRATVESEKLPLARELTALEERVTELRREHERVTRLRDAGNLEIAAIKGEIKLRQDELDYVGNLLDEYARSFESKVNVSELQGIGPAIQNAKEAAENDTLAQDERFSVQLALVEASVRRLFDVAGGMTFPGVAVDPEGTVVNGQFALIGPAALFRAQNGVAGLVVPQSGSTNPLIRPLEGPMQAGIVSLLSNGQGLFPLDPSLGGALKALVQKTSLIHIFEKGGPIMWPLLAASILALGTVLERLFFLMRERFKRDPRAVEAFFAAITRGDEEEAIRLSKASKFHVVRALGYALAHKETSLANALLYAQGKELKRFQRGIPILDTVITLAPLLGLLGTVTGMMGSFSLIGGELSAPGAITGGIAEALIATAFGLGIAITALLPFNFLNARMDEARHELESASTQLELLVQPRVVIPSSRDRGRAEADPHDHDGRGHRASGEDGRREREHRRKRQEIRRRIAELQTELEEELEGVGGERETT